MSDESPTEDRREDEGSRDRIYELSASWNASVAALDARYRRITLLNHGTTLLAILAVAFCIVLLKQADHAAEDNRHALCSLRVDLEVRVEAGEKFLQEHPEGFAGVAAADIAMSLRGQRRTIVALSDLDCTPERAERELLERQQAKEAATVRKP